MMGMKRLEQADFIRVISTFGIILFHFSSEMAARGISGLKPLYHAPNFTYGSLFVTVFFLLSGGMVHYSFQKKHYSAKQYYKKRMASIFPAFYLIFFPLYAKSAWQNGSFFYNGRPASLLLSFIGMDGYFSYRFSTYYQIGEWFLGAVILLYLVYPLLHLCAERHELITTVVIFAAYLSVFASGDFYLINDFQNFFSCLISFWLGMLLIQHRERLLEKAWAGWTGAICLMFLLLVKIPLSENLSAHMAGIFCFCSLYAIGGHVMKWKFLRNAVRFVSAISYSVYLVHHVILSIAMNRLPGDCWPLWQTCFYLAALISVILLAGYIISVTVNLLGRLAASRKEKNAQREKNMQKQ